MHFHDFSIQVGNTAAVLHIGHSIDKVYKEVIPLIAQTALIGAVTILVAILLSLFLAYWTTREVYSTTSALRESEERMRSVFLAAPTGIGLVIDRVLKQVNERMCKMTGFSEAELIDRNVRMLYPSDEDYEYVGREKYAQIRDHGTGTVETRLKCKDGRIIDVLLSSTPLDLGDMSKGVTFTALDITERKRADVERERLMLAIEQAAETIVIADAEGTVQYVNPAFNQITGYSRNEVIGQNPRILKSGEHNDAFYKAMWNTISQGKTWSGRIVNKKKDGTLYTEEATISPVRDALGMTINYVAVKRDITQEIKLEDQLRQAQKMEAVGQLAGGVAHDFNNLLQVILGYGDMALDDMEVDSSVRASVEEMLKAGHRATTLVSQLLAFSRRQMLEIKDVNLNHVIADLMKMIRRVIGEHITLDVLAGHDLGIVLADPGQIEQILINLCVNARDAMPTGGTITIETENVRINKAYCETHTWAEPGRYVLLSMTDTGGGMDKETLGKVFEPFFTTKELGKGSGLGLSTVYGLVKQHQGMVHAYSELGNGTTFKIYLPLVERSAVAVGNKIEGPLPGGTEIILLAEDEETVRKLIKAILERAGYRVLTVCDGDEALRVFEEHADKIDLALLDVMMPKLGGKAVFERIREKRPEVRVLFSSGYSMNSIHTNFVLDEGMALIQKPYQHDQLLRKVREVLDK